MGGKPNLFISCLNADGCPGDRAVYNQIRSTMQSLIPTELTNPASGDETYLKLIGSYPIRYASGDSEAFKTCPLRYPLDVCLRICKKNKFAGWNAIVVPNPTECQCWWTNPSSVDWTNPGSKTVVHFYKGT